MMRLVDEHSAASLVAAMSERSILVQPFGSIEQHGPHLPLATDSIIVEAVARSLVERYGDEHDLWLLPSLRYTKSDEHASFPGTVWLSSTTMLSVVDDLARSLAMLPARRLVFLNGHGGNSALLNVACREVRRRYGFLTFLAHVHTAQGGGTHEGEQGMGIHGGMEETSAMLHLRPDLVDVSALAARVPEALTHNRHVRFGGTVGFGWLAEDFGPDGHIGDPRRANAELGKVAFEAGVARLGEAMGEVARFSFPIDTSGAS
jgi:creatinine amidohydrolase